MPETREQINEKVILQIVTFLAFLNKGVLTKMWQVIAFDDSKGYQIGRKTKSVMKYAQRKMRKDYKKLQPSSEDETYCAF